MIQRALASKGLVAYVLACATGIALYFRWPFPENDLMLHLISIRIPWLALLPSIAFALVLAQRTRLEDNSLRCNLPGYAEYVKNVPGRLLPIKKPRKSLYVRYSA